MWPRGSHTLVTLTVMASNKRKFKQKKVKQDNFEEIKWNLNTLLTYPNSNEAFKIHTDASAFQLGSVISHKDKPITFYGRKLTDYQKWYEVTEK